MISRKAFLKVFSVLVLLAFIVGNSGYANVIAQSAPDGPPGSGGNPVIVDAPVAPTSPIDRSIDKSTIDLNRTMRFIVQLQDAPLASYSGEIQGLQSTAATATGAARLNVNSSAAKAYEQHLASQQETFTNALNSALPGAKVERNFRITLNAVVVQATMADVKALRSLPGVTNIAVEKEYKLQMDASVPQLGLGTGTLGGGDWVDKGLWEAVGGHANAGAGIKIADIDSGITPSNPCFDPTGFSMPAGYPKGETAITNAKIIVARSYFRATDPPFFSATAIDDPGVYGGGHGTHTAGTMVCNYGTTTTFSGIKISGLAPKAQLMVYKVFYYSIEGSLSAYTPELLAAIEDAVRDGADVVNNSWGGANWNTGWDPEVAAYEAAVDSGVVIVFSAGNSGPDAMTAGSPGSNSNKFITVAASTTARTFKTTLKAESRSDAVNTLPADIIGRSLTQSQVTAPIVDLQASGYADSIACNGTLPTNLVSGKIVVVRRGVCALVDKVANAKAGGAVGVVIRNIADGAATLPLISPVLPTIHILQADGDALYSFLTGLPKGVTATFTIVGPATLDLSGDAADVVAVFSSRGPAPDMTLKPDIAAPGVNILSSVSAADFGSSQATFDFYQGTSMAAPHVTGAAALLRQLHPDWSPAAVRSALMSTAVEPVSLSTNPADRGSGRLSLTAPHTVELVFDKPSLSFGLLGTGEPAETITVTAANTTSSEVTYTLAVIASAGGDAPVVQVSGNPVTLITVPANNSVAFDVVLTPTIAEVAYGKLTLTDSAGDSPSLHLPYWVRRVVPLPEAMVYLVDGDGSGSKSSCPASFDVSTIYTDTLTGLGISYNLVTANLFNFYQARRHNYVLYFDGSSFCGGYLSMYGNSLRNYLAQGGKLIAMGQDIAFEDVFLAQLGFSFDPLITLGFDFVQDNVGSNSDLFVVNGGDNPWLAGTAIQLDPATSTSIDEVYPAFFTDLDTLPLFKLNNAPEKIAPDGPFVGTRTSSEPTIERVKGEAEWFPTTYRTLYTAFGLENITDAGAVSAVAARADLIGKLEKWLVSKTEIQFAAPSFSTPQPDIGVEIVVTGVNNLNNKNVVQFRFDFGDGSPIVTVPAEPGGPTLVNHKFATVGKYTVYVEAEDIYGHKVVATTTVTVGTPIASRGNRVYFPVIGR